MNRFYYRKGMNHRLETEVYTANAFYRLSRPRDLQPPFLRAIRDAIFLELQDHINVIISDQ